MPAGLLIDLNDGGPRMEITSGLRFPTFSGQWTTASTSLSLDIANYVPGSEVILLPRVCAAYSPPVGTSLVPSVGVLTGFTQSGSTVTQTYWDSKGDKLVRGFDASVWQILPASTGSGMLIQDSTDFMSIALNTMAGFCVWRGSVTFTGTWALPDTIAPKSNYMVFGKWSHPSATVECDGTVVTAYEDRNGEDVPATVTITIAIFASGIAPTPGPGLNFFKNNACVFSTTNRPFIYNRKTWTPSWSWTDIGDNMIMLGVYGYDSNTNGGWDYMKLAGIVRSGNAIRCGRGRVRWRWTDRYALVGQRLTNIPVPCIPAMY